jgi:predicted anti-sigma-YlaC factor YlaD
MALHPRPVKCERARAWTSLRLDGELSELEGALLTAHLRQCRSCAEYAESVEGAVEALRSQPLEEPDFSIAVRARRRIPLRPAALARIAAAAAVVAGVTTVLSSEPTHRTITTQAPTSGITSAPASEDNDLKQLRMLRRIQLGGRPPQRSGIGEFGAVLSGRP